MSRDNETREHWTPVQAAAYHLLSTYEHDGHRGAQAMGPRIGKVPRVLNNEINPNYEDAKLGLNTAILMELESGRADILHGHAQMLRHVCFKLPDIGLAIGDAELLGSFSEWQSRMGVTCEHIRSALDPNGPNGTRITITEANEIEAAGMVHISKFMEFLEKVRELAE